MRVGNLGNLAKFHQEEISGKRQICIWPPPQTTKTLKANLEFWIREALFVSMLVAGNWQGHLEAGVSTGPRRNHFRGPLRFGEWETREARRHLCPPGMRQREKGPQSARMVLPAPCPHPRGPLSDFCLSPEPACVGTLRVS